MAASQGNEGRAKATARTRPGTRERLVAAATELMWEQGIGDVSVEAILDHADVLKGSFYHFFPSKSALLLECLDNVWRAQSEQLAIIYTETADPTEALWRHFQMIRQEQVAKRRQLGFVPGMFNASLPTALLRDERITGRIRELMDSHARYLETGLRRVAETGGLDQSAADIARLLRYALSGALLAARMHNSLEPLDDFELILRQILDGSLADTR